MRDTTIRYIRSFLFYGELAIMSFLIVYCLITASRTAKNVHTLYDEGRDYYYNCEYAKAVEKLGELNNIRHRSLLGYTNYGAYNDLIVHAKYNLAVECIESGNYTQAVDYLVDILDYENSRELLHKCIREA